MVLCGQGLGVGAVVGVEERRAWKNRQLKAEGKVLLRQMKAEAKGVNEKLWAFLNE